VATGYLKGKCLPSDPVAFLGIFKVLLIVCICLLIAAADVCLLCVRVYVRVQRWPTSLIQDLLLGETQSAKWCMALVPSLEFCSLS
jgi:hypothetical protein